MKLFIKSNIPERFKLRKYNTGVCNDTIYVHNLPYCQLACINWHKQTWHYFDLTRPAYGWYYITDSHLMLLIKSKECHCLVNFALEWPE